MKNYYEFLLLTPHSSTEEIKKAIHKKRKEISKIKLDKEHKKKIEKELNDSEFILLDYHRRKEYDYYFYIYFFPQKHRYYVENEITTPTHYLENYVEPTTPSVFEDEFLPNENQIENSYQHQIITSHSSTYIQSGTDGTIVYRKNYQNINGKEKEEEDKYFIDKNGRKQPLLL